jgi:decaprenyl-phosphate phosphoribosyltransferase
MWRYTFNNWKLNMNIEPYIKICRFDHWVKNIFLVPGLFFGFYFRLNFSENYSISMFNIFEIILCFLATGFAASANYTINEYLDKEFDKNHPIKKNRMGAIGKLDLKIVIIQYISLVALGSFIAYQVNLLCLFSVIFLMVMGIIYNVSPLRSKDIPYIDVVSESINNPIRFVIGWSAFYSNELPPSSILICYWMGGAYLMALKRFAEIRMIDNKQDAELYRKSFRFYSEINLLESSIFYAVISGFFLAIFLVKYRIEYIFTFPFLALLYAYYFRISFQQDSTAAAPEKLHKEKNLIYIVLLLCGAFILTSSINVPSLDILLIPVSFK